MSNSYRFLAHKIFQENIKKFLTGYPAFKKSLFTNLEKAILRRANLKGADLRQANLTQADLSGATLSWANLTGAKVTEAQWSQASDLEGVILPDGSTTNG